MAARTRLTFTTNEPIPNFPKSELNRLIASKILKLNLRKHRDSTAEPKPDSTYWLKRSLRQGAVTVWESPGTDVEINNRIRELLKSAEPLIRTAPATDKHKTPEPEMDHFRVSILTYGGIHTVEVFGPDLNEGHQMAPTLLASVKVLDALQQKADEAEKSKGKVKPH